MSEPTEEAIRTRAYELWERAGRPDGGHEEHWLEAERQLRAEEAQQPGRSRPDEATETDPPAHETPIPGEQSRRTR